MNLSDRKLKRRELMELGITFLTGMAVGSLITEGARRAFSNHRLDQTELLQDITQRGMSLNQLVASSPYPPGTQWLHLVVQPNYKVALPYLELSNGNSKG